MIADYYHYYCYNNNNNYYYNYNYNYDYYYYYCHYYHYYYYYSCCCCYYYYYDHYGYDYYYNQRQEQRYKLDIHAKEQSQYIGFRGVNILRCPLSRVGLTVLWTRNYGLEYELIRERTACVLRKHLRTDGDPEITVSPKSPTPTWRFRGSYK